MGKLDEIRQTSPMDHGLREMNLFGMLSSDSAKQSELLHAQSSHRGRMKWPCMRLIRALHLPLKRYMAALDEAGGRGTRGARTSLVGISLV